MKKRLFLVPIVMLALTLSGCPSSSVTPTNNVQQDIATAQNILNGYAIALSVAPAAVVVVCSVDPNDCATAQKALSSAQTAYTQASAILANCITNNIDPNSISTWATVIADIATDISQFNDAEIAANQPVLPTSQIQLNNYKMSIKK
jgi:hypothetical protein